MRSRTSAGDATPVNVSTKGQPTLVSIRPERVEYKPEALPEGAHTLDAEVLEFIYMGDMWWPPALDDSRYFWMPLEIGGGKLWLPEPRPWTIDVNTGETSFLDAPVFSPRVLPPKASAGTTQTPAP